MTTKIQALLLLILLLPCCVSSETQRDETPQSVRQAIDNRFPGAEIKETEQELWKGEKVTEVELTSENGVDYEALVSTGGEILHIEEDRGLPLIGGDFSLGFALRGEKEIYKDVGVEWEPTPFFMYENGPLEILGYDGVETSLRFYENENLSLALCGSLKFDEGYDPDDSDYFDGMECVQQRLAFSVGVSPTGVRVRSPVAWIA